MNYKSLKLNNGETYRMYELKGDETEHRERIFHLYQSSLQTNH